MTNIYSPYFYNTIVLEGLKSKLIEVPTYLYVADGLTDSATPETLTNNFGAYQNTMAAIISGKKIVAGDIFPMIRRIPYQSGVVYPRYSTSEDLSNEDFFVINSQRAVYKCIDNNYGAESTIEPTTLDTVPTTLADGYVWQYMYRLTSTQLNRYCTTDYLVVIPDDNVTANAIPGTVDHITVTASGDSYLTNSGTIQQIAANCVYKIDSSGSAIDGAYVNSAVYISGGPGAGAISEISQYYTNASGRFIHTDESLANVTISSTYTIAPAVRIIGNGMDAKARAIMDGDIVSSIEVLNRGTEYSGAEVQVVANTVGGSGATAYATLSPPKGHGSDVSSELFARQLLVTVTLDGSELDTIPTETSFSRYGLVRGIRQAANTEVTYSANTFTNVVRIDYTTIYGEFSVGDLVRNTTNTLPVATVLWANGSQMIAQYQSKYRFNDLYNLSSESGALASIGTIVQPVVDLQKADLLSVASVSTVDRSTDTEEMINLILSV